MTGVGDSSQSGVIWKALYEAGLPILTPVAELLESSAIGRHPAYQWEGVWLRESRPLLPVNTLWPWFWRRDERYAASLPPVEFSTHVWLGDDAKENIEAALHMLSRVLGPTSIQARYNTLEATWHDGARSVQALVFPPGKNLGKSNNPSHDREPRLKTACHVSVRTGYMPPLTLEEMRAAKTAKLHVALDGVLPSAFPTAFSGPPVHTLEFARRPEPSMNELAAGVSISADKELFFYQGRHLYVFPVGAVRSIDVVRMKPAKGGGGSWIEISVDGIRPESPAKSVVAAEAAGPDDLSQIASEVAVALGKPLNLKPYAYDC